MARDRFRELRERREREDEEDRQREAVKSASKSPGVGATRGSRPVNLHEDTGAVDVQSKLADLLDRAGPLVESVNASYNQYFSGVEMKPPIERRRLLDSTMAQLEAVPKPTLNQQWRYNNLLNTYVTYRNRWDKMTQGIESGRIKRTAGQAAARGGVKRAA